MIHIYDRDGMPISVEEHARLLGQEEYRRVADDQVGSYWISTVWLGYDHGFGRTGAPVIFETMVFAENGKVGPELEQRRYSTEAEALAGHAETVLLVRATIQEDIPTEERVQED